MKGTENFTRVIADYLNNRAMTDPLFAPNLQKPNKNIEDRVTYILNQVQQSGCNGFEDDEIYSMAVHYYDEDDLEIGEKSNCSVVVNHIVELTEEEKAEQKQKALEEYKREQLKTLRQADEKRLARVQKAKAKENENVQTLFFDM